MTWLVNPYILGAEINATGGLLTFATIGADVYAIHTFTEPVTYTFDVSQGSGEVDYLLVGGGGGGGSRVHGNGGGGGGGVLSGTTTATVGQYSIVVGRGGPGGRPQGGNAGGLGGNTTAFGLTAVGGGGGGGSGSSVNNRDNGGSGGGAGSNSSGDVSGGTGTVGQGNNGGTATYNATVSARGSGGGGGAGGVGGDGGAGTGGAGGAGVSSSITGTAKFYAGGGGGSGQTSSGSGGSSVGGAGGTGNAVGGNGVVNTGSGGGGAGGADVANAKRGGSGGHGVVIIRYKVTNTTRTYISAYGGDSVYYVSDYFGQYYVHRYTTTGTSSFVMNNNGSVEYLVVAGGGGGGADFGAGGGAGGMRSGQLSLTAGSHTVTVGTGGPGATNAPVQATKGGDSIFSTITSTGGGAGASGSSKYNASVVNDGGSGGGGGGYNATANADSGVGNTPSTSPAQGFNGSTGFGANGDTTSAAGGGGGASQQSGSATANNPGSGGQGKASIISGTESFYAGGGGGGSYTTGQASAAQGGQGGGGAGAVGTSVSGTSATANTGGGGGGNSGGGAGTGGNGGSGIVIVRYPTPKLGIVTSNILYHHNAGTVQSYPGTGTAVKDISGNAYNSTLTGGALYSSSNGGIFDLDGTDDHIAIPSTMDLRRNFSIEMWVNPDVVNGFVFFGQGSTANNSGLHIWMTSATNLRFGMYSNDFDVTAAMSAGTWYHFVFTYNHSSPFTKQIYMNGVLQSGTNVGGPAQYSGTGQSNIGRTYSAGTNYGNGKYGEVRVYSSILSGTDVTTNFNDTKARYGL